MTRFWPRGPGHDDGVTDVLGSILLVGVTVTMMTGLSMLVLNVDAPDPVFRADLVFMLLPGADGWDSGDEVIRLYHNGGHDLPVSGTKIIITIQGTIFEFEKAALDGGFGDGKLVIGESWQRTFTLAQGTEVKGTIIGMDRILVRSPTAGQAAVASGNIDPCAQDATPPGVAQWTQSPPDLDGKSNGPVAITAALSDACSGVNESIAPKLFYRINDGTDPAFTEAGTMTPLGAARWSGEIPAQPWLSLAGQTLEYKLTSFADKAGNTATSQVRSDAITGSATVLSYVQSYVGSMGTVENFAAAQTDGAPGATLKESDGSTTPRPLYGKTASGSGWAGEPVDVLGAPDDSRMVIKKNGHALVQQFSVPFGATGVIDKVELVMEGHYVDSGSPNDKARLYLGLPVCSATCVPATEATLEVDTFAIARDNDARYVRDISGMLGQLEWSYVSMLAAQANYVQVNNNDNMQIHIDALYIQVTTSAARILEVQFDFPSLPAGTDHNVEIQYAATSETFSVQVWDGDGWNARGAAITASNTWSYTLDGSEIAVDGLGPRLRILDASAASPQGTLQIYHARVAST